MTGGRPRGVLTDMHAQQLETLRVVVEQAKEEYRDAVLFALGTGASFAEVSKATGLSTNTLQRWKREEWR